MDFRTRELPHTKQPIGISVYDAACERISQAFDKFERIYVSFSAGKDSTVMLHMVAKEARRRGRTIAVMLVDLEAQYKLTMQHAEQMRREYADCTEWYWCCLPIALRNAVSVYQPKWLCWDDNCPQDWVREKPKFAKSDFPFAWKGMEFEEFVPLFGEWYSEGKETACFVGIRTDESLNRFRTIHSDKKVRKDGLCYSTQVTPSVYNWYPIYDWSTEDIWVYHAKTGDSYNKLYDLMHQAGMSIHQMRICQPYGDDQRRGLWLYHLIEPETWGKVVARVNGANSGSLYVQDTGNINGYGKITLPEGHTWRSFATLLLNTLPKKTREHFQAKIDVHRKWWMDRGYPDGIPDEADAKMEAQKKAPSWRRICKAILRNDYWCKTLGFSQHSSGTYERYLKMMRKRREKPEWKLNEREKDQMPLFD